MSLPVLDLNNPGVWNQIYDESRTAASGGIPDSYIPIPAFEVPVLIQSPILAVRNFSQSARPTWRFAGNLIQRFQIGTGGSASPLPLAEAKREALTVNRTQLIFFPRYTNEYEVVFSCPYWFQTMRLTLWEYTGQISDSNQVLIEAVRTDLVIIESKIDAL